MARVLDVDEREVSSTARRVLGLSATEVRDPAFRPSPNHCLKIAQALGKSDVWASVSEWSALASLKPARQPALKRDPFAKNQLAFGNLPHGLWVHPDVPDGLAGLTQLCQRLGIVLQHLAAHGRTHRHGPAWLSRWVGETAATACGLVLGLGLGGVLLDGHPMFLLGSNVWLLIAVLLSGVGLAGSIAAERLWEVRNRLERARREALVRDKALAEAELRVLQAQVEPHFLFNTLANVISLIHTHPDRAARLLERLTSLLRASLSRTRRADGTLGDELAVVRAYLDIQSLRMAGRMTFELNVDPGLEAVRMPPLLLQPLVENAVLHGIEPSAAGGRVVVHAERSAGVVQVRVTDDGVGLDPDTAPHGVGIANVRERLQATFGEGGRLALSENPGGGVSAELQFPAAPAVATEVH